jgi:quinol monooxygenase YgiN
VIIVGGNFTIEGGRRDEFIAERLEAMKVSRAEAGCLEYAFCADPIEADRVILFERWETQDALDAHLQRIRSEPPAERKVAAEKALLTMYDAEVQPPKAP